MGKNIIIGIDGATWDNLKPWIDKGELPFFNKIIKEGVHGINKTTIPCQTSPAIPCFYTGLNPVKTKTFGFRKRDGRMISSRDIKGKRCWDILGENGKKSFIYGLRTTYPPKIKNGVLLSSILVPDEESDFVCPKSEKQFFKGYLGEDIPKKDIIKMQKEDRDKLLNMLLESEENRIRLIKEYLKDKEFDFYLFYFGITDTIQHYLWNDPKLILKTYKRIEKIIEELLKRLDYDNVIIFSDHGFGKAPEKTFYIERWMDEKNFLKYKKGFYSLMNKFYKKTYYSIGWTLEKYLSVKHFLKIYKLFKGKKQDYPINIDPCESDIAFLNMRSTKAYLDQKWGIKVIRKEGADKDYEKTRDSIIKEMKKIKDDKGIKVFKEVHKKEDIYSGAEKIDEIPDIIFTADQQYEIRAGYNKKIFESIKTKRMVEGSHEYQREGIFMASGKDIEKNKKIDAEIYDITPTLIHIYDLAIPKNIDGKVLTKIFKKNSDQSKRKIRYIKEKEEDSIKSLVSSIKI